MARESACMFPLLGMCNRVRDSNLDFKCLTKLKYLAFSYLLLLVRPSPGRRPASSPRTYLLLFFLVGSSFVYSSLVLGCTPFSLLLVMYRIYILIKNIE